MEHKSLTFRKSGTIGIVTLKRPDHGNTVTSEIASDFSEIRQQLGYGSDIVSLVITGEGEDAFSMGSDTDEIAAYEDRNILLERLQTAATIGAIDQPTLAVINGDAFDQGLELALACDLRIASQDARFAMTQVGQGSLPWDGGTQRLSRLVGRGKAMEMILLGEIIDAEEARRIGLVNRVVPSDSLMDTGMKMARELASKGPIALRYAKEAINKGMDMSLYQGLRLEADLYFLLHTTEDRTEGINAFREKRDPTFIGK